MNPLPASSLLHLGCYGLPRTVLSDTIRRLAPSGALLRSGYARDTDGRAVRKVSPQSVRYTLDAAFDHACAAAMPPHLHALYQDPLMILVRHLTTQAAGADLETMALKPSTTQRQVLDALSQAHTRATRLDADPTQAWAATGRLFAEMTTVLERGWLPGTSNACCETTRRATTPRAFHDACRALRRDLGDDILYAHALWGAYAVLESLIDSPDLSVPGHETPYTASGSRELAQAARRRAEDRAADAAP